jgi:hypothetical protein
MRVNKTRRKRTVVTEEAMDECRRLWETGKSFAAISSITGISEPTISKICSNVKILHDKQTRHRIPAPWESGPRLKYKPLTPEQMDVLYAGHRYEDDPEAVAECQTVRWWGGGSLMG